MLRKASGEAGIVVEAEGEADVVGRNTFHQKLLGKGNLLGVDIVFQGITDIIFEHAAQVIAVMMKLSGDDFHGELVVKVFIDEIEYFFHDRHHGVLGFCYGIVAVVVGQGHKKLGQTGPGQDGVAEHVFAQRFL